LSRACLSVVVQDVASHPDTPDANAIRAWIRSAAGERGGEVTVRIVTPAESAALNRRYRGRPKPTNVLSFPVDDDYPEIDDEPRPLGDIVVCAEVVARECAEQGKSNEAHWAHMVVHGTLHLLGFDHETDAEAEVMEGRERVLLAGFGFPDPYLAA